MNAGPIEAQKLAEELSKTWGDKKLRSVVVVCPPFISIPYVTGDILETDMHVGGQDVHTEDSGAYTGEISADMLYDAGCTYAIIGHSERREYAGESDTLIAKKSKKALDAGLIPIVCVGEKLEQRKAGTHQKVVMDQVDAVINRMNRQDAPDFVIAYEPVWAIGTGETATPEQAQEMHLFIRNLLAERWGADRAGEVRILYGGSMKPGNAEELLSQDDVDGGLIGGASLQADSFSEIISISEKLLK